MDDHNSTTERDWRYRKRQFEKEKEMVGGRTLDPSKDDLVNDWGTHYLASGVSRYRGSFSELDGLVKSSVPGFKLQSLQPSGSVANEVAIGRATTYDLATCLVASGSYIGGTGKLLDMSGLGPLGGKSQLAEMKTPAEASPNCRLQTVGFPYHVPHEGLDQEELATMENNCLFALHKKIVVAKLNGKPYKALIMEYILAGNGGELTNSFLVRLGRLLSKFKINVVIDEIMTGGRVGPTMVMTTSAPAEFSKCVTNITLGKIFNCGLVLERSTRSEAMSKEYQDRKYYRGHSTTICPDEACCKWQLIYSRILDGEIEKRRDFVIKAFKIPVETFWGKGGLMFFEKYRPSISQNLKCRLLPMLEPGKKIRKETLKQSEYTRKSLCQLLFATEKLWIQESIVTDEANNNSFLLALADMIMKDAPSVFPPSQLLDFIGEKRAKAMAENERCTKRGQECTKKATAFANSVLKRAAQVSNGYVVRFGPKGKKRKLHYMINEKASSMA